MHEGKIFMVLGRLGRNIFKIMCKQVQTEFSKIWHENGFDFRTKKAALTRCQNRGHMKQILFLFFFRYRAGLRVEIQNIILHIKIQKCLFT